MTGYTDYMFLLRPSDEVCNEIKSYKQFAAGLVGEYPSLHSTAHISVVKYIRKKHYIMRQGIDALGLTLKKIPAVRLRVNGFRFFIHKNDTYTIYAIIEPTLQSNAWFALLSKHMNLVKGSFVPHITIARTINENAFFKLWPHFKYMTFKCDFIVTGLTVLERETLNTRAKWSVCKELSFKPLPLEQPA